MGLFQSSTVETTPDWRRIFFQKPFTRQIIGWEEENWWLRMGETCRIGRQMTSRYLRNLLVDASHRFQYFDELGIQVGELQESLLGEDTSGSTIRRRGRVLTLRFPTDQDALDFEWSLRELMVYYSGVSPV